MSISKKEVITNLITSAYVLLENVEQGLLSKKEKHDGKTKFITATVNLLWAYLNPSYDDKITTKDVCLFLSKE